MIKMNNGIIFNNNELSDLLCGKMPLNEVYIGKTKELLAAEQQLDKFRNKYLGRYTFNMKVNSDPDLLKFNRMIEKIFGFGCFTLHIHNQQHLNAFTAPIDSKFDYNMFSDNIVVDENGFKFKVERDYACITGITSGFIFNPDYTTGENFAIILHEIGHNFYGSINYNNGIFSRLFMNSVYILYFLSKNWPIDILMNTNFYKKFIDKTIRSMRENNNKVPIFVYDAFTMVMDIIDDCNGHISDAISILSLGTYATVKSGLIIMNRLIRDPIRSALVGFYYRNEETADNFATIYGYGGELSSALGKMRDKEGASSTIIMGTFDKIPLISTIMHFNEMPGLLLISLFDEHPKEVDRIKDQIELLKYELKKEDIDPKMAKCIEADLKLCEEALNTITDYSNHIKDPYLGQKLYNHLASNCISIKGTIFGGHKRKFENYDKTFKKYNK